MSLACNNLDNFMKKNKYLIIITFVSVLCFLFCFAINYKKTDIEIPFWTTMFILSISWYIFYLYKLKKVFFGILLIYLWIAIIYYHIYSVNPDLIKNYFITLY